jgi:hypothetical protein
MEEKRIISVALTGSWGTKEQNPEIPMTPADIAEDAYRCCLAGAAIAHIHMRDEEMKPKMDTERFRETIARIREKCDIIINMTSSGDPIGSDDIRIAPLEALKPEMASYDSGTMNWLHNSVFTNHPAFLERLGLVMQKHNIKPELEIFDCGMLYNTFYRGYWQRMFAWWSARRTLSARRAFLRRLPPRQGRYCAYRAIEIFPVSQGANRLPAAKIERRHCGRGRPPPAVPATESEILIPRNRSASN